MKLLSAPKNRGIEKVNINNSTDKNTNTYNNGVNLREIKLVLRIVFAVVFFILGFNISRSAFFLSLPFFGYHTIIEVLVSLAMAAFGYFVFPRVLVQVKTWFEGIIDRTVTEIVSSFWDQQSKRIQEARREKQKIVSERILEEEKKKKDSFKDLCNESSIVLDTSVLVDGRILDVVKTGFLDYEFIVLQAVLDELQLVADNKNKIKRQRGRRGLDVVRDLKRVSKVSILDFRNDVKEVDKLLVKFAKEYKLKLMTMDFNLNKVANLNGIKVLNLNDLINSLKTVLLPDEEINIKIIQEGKERKQGIGYLEDGTMVVVEDTKDMLGNQVKARVKKVIQSSAGRMFFCDLIREDSN